MESKLTADYLYPLHISPIKEGVLQISDEGEVLHIFHKRNEVSFDKLEIFEGVLCPGFINAHCHLELSHLKGITEEGKGFLNFIETVFTKENNIFVFLWKNGFSDNISISSPISTQKLFFSPKYDP